MGFFMFCLINFERKKRFHLIHNQIAILLSGAKFAYQIELKAYHTKNKGNPINMAKKTLFLLILLALGLPTFAYQSVYGQEQIDLSIACTCNPIEAEWLNEVVVPRFVDEMAKEGKSYTVEVIDYALSDEEYREQLALDFSLGEGSDLVGFDGFWVPEFVDQGLLKPLNEVAGPDVDEWEGWGHIPPGIQQILSYRGERYGVPKGTDIRVIYYRTDLFEEAGIEVPWQPASWQDILDTSEKLQKAGIENPLQINAGTLMGEATTMQGYFMVLLGTGIHMYDFEESKWIVNSPAIVDALGFYQEIYASSNPVGNVDMQLAEDGRNQSFEAFQQGNTAILAEGVYFWNAVIAPDGIYPIENRNDVVSWAAMPAIDPGVGYNQQDYVSISGGSGWTMNPNTPYPEDAWRLLTLLSSKESSQSLQEIRPTVSFRDDIEIADEVIADMSELLLPITTVRPLLPFYPQVSFEAQLMTELVITGEMTPAEAMQAYDDAVTALVGEDNVIRIPSDQ